MSGEQKPQGGYEAVAPVTEYDAAAFGRITVIVAPDRRHAWALCQEGWDDDACSDWATATTYLERYGLADVRVDPRTDWFLHPDGSDTFILRKDTWR